MLLKKADAAMYHAKNSGRNNFQFFKQSLNTATIERSLFEQDLKDALIDNQFCLFFQPQIRLSDRKIIGGEALLRWKHPRKGLLIPKDFLSIAEESDLITNINKWVIQTACHFSSQLRQKGTHLKIAINLSGKDLTDTNTLQMLNKALSCNSLEGNHIEIDVAEEKSIQKNTSIINVLKDMKKMNLKIALDDFGVGHSSLSYLTSFEADRIKIDHSFIKKCANKNAIKAIIALGHSLDMKIIAEGVETEDEFQFLKTLGCDECQGYLFSPPVSKENFLTLLEQGIL